MGFAGGSRTSPLNFVNSCTHNPKVGGSNPAPRNQPLQSVASLPVISPAHFALTQPAVAHGLGVQVKRGAMLECRSSSLCTSRGCSIHEDKPAPPSRAPGKPVRRSVGSKAVDETYWTTLSPWMNAIWSDYSRSMFVTTMRTARILDSGRERRTAEFVR